MNDTHVPTYMICIFPATVRISMSASMPASFGEGAIAFFNSGWKATLVVVPPKAGFGKRSAKDPGIVYIDDEKTPDGVFRKLPVMGWAGNDTCDLFTFRDWRNGEVTEVKLEVTHYPRQKVHAEFDDWLALRALAALPRPKKFVPLMDPVVIH